MFNPTGTYTASHFSKWHPLHLVAFGAPSGTAHGAPWPLFIVVPPSDMFEPATWPTPRPQLALARNTKPGMSTPPTGGFADRLFLHPGLRWQPCGTNGVSAAAGGRRLACASARCCKSAVRGAGMCAQQPQFSGVPTGSFSERSDCCGVEVTLTGSAVRSGSGQRAGVGLASRRGIHAGVATVL